MASPTVLTHLASGAVSGVLSRCLTAPISTAKTNVQTLTACTRTASGGMTRNEARALRSSFSAILAAESWPGLWKGNSIAVARIIPYMAVRFAVYEELKLAAIAYSSQSLPPGGPGVDDPEGGGDGAGFGPGAKFAAGSLAGLSAVLVTYPLDLLKTSRTVTPLGHPSAKSVASAVRMHVKAGKGWSGLFRGFTPTLLGIVLHDGTAFLVFETAKQMMVDSDLSDPESESEIKFAHNFVFGALAGMAARTVSLPFDVVRKRLMVQPLLDSLGKHNLGSQARAFRFDSMLSTFADTIRHEGWRALWRGRLSNRISMILSAAVSFSLYEQCKRVMEKLVYIDDDHP